MPPRLQPPYLVLQDFLSPEQHSTLLDWTLSQQPRFKPAGIGGSVVDPTIRRCERLNDLGPLESVFTERLLTGYPGWLKHLKISPFDQSRVELQIAAYGDGAHFAFHTDTASAGKPTRRLLTATYYFYREPKAFTGGDLRIYDIGSHEGSSNFIIMPPEQNTLVVFPSWIGHDVTTVVQTTGDFADFRFVVNCWLHRSA